MLQNLILNISRRESGKGNEGKEYGDILLMR